MPTHYRGAPSEVAALDAYIKLMRAAESVTARLEPSMAAAGLTVGQFGALEALWHLGPLCQRDLGRKLLRSSGNITVVVGNLALRGLVRRARRRRFDRRFITVKPHRQGPSSSSAFSSPRHVSLLAAVRWIRSRRSEQTELGRLCRDARTARAEAGSRQERRSAMAQSQATSFGSLERYEKGGVEVIDDDAEHYVFSNVFEVASKSKPYEKVAVGKNMRVRARGHSGRGHVAAGGRRAHDEFALVMDGEVEVELRQARRSRRRPRRQQGSVALAASRRARRWARSRPRRGHMTLLPAGAAYQFHAARPASILLQTHGRPPTRSSAGPTSARPTPRAAGLRSDAS